MLTDDQVRVACASILFKGLDAEAVRSLPDCLGARVRRVAKGDALLRAGEAVHEAGVVLDGALSLVKDDFWGNRSLVAKIGPAGVFAEAMACLPAARSEVTAIADSDAEVLFVDARRIMDPCAQTCVLHGVLLRNLLEALAFRAGALVTKLGHVSKRTTREKLLSYFSEQALKAGCASFDLALTRQELANYLFVERSAMSAELGRMARDGLVEVSGRRVTLKGDIPLRR